MLQLSGTVTILKTAALAVTGSRFQGHVISTCLRCLTETFRNIEIKLPKSPKLDVLMIEKLNEFVCFYLNDPLSIVMMTALQVTVCEHGKVGIICSV